MDRHTPGIAAIDGRGLALRQIAYWRREVDDVALARITRSTYDSAGRAVAQTDPRLTQPNLLAVYSLSGAALSSDSVDAGWRLNLSGEAQQMLESWDGRGTYRRGEYDALLRPVALYESASGQPAETVERMAYASNAAEFAARNQCGQLLRHDDPAGTLLYEQHALTGELISQTRGFLPAEQTADWPVGEAARDALLEPDKRYTTRQRYSPVGEVLQQTDAADHQQRWAFDRAGQLKGIELTLKGQSAQPLLNNVEYNAQGQLVSQLASNGVISVADFEPSTGRLLSLSAAASGKGLLQDLSYEYDPVGNICLLADHVQPVRYFANQRVEPQNSYTYDSLYQLTRATGREAVGASISPGLPELVSPIDPSLLLNYTQEYDYDAGGNFTVLRHMRAGNNYTRTMRVADGSNRALPWEEGAALPEFDRQFDANGNLQTLVPGAQPMLWDRRNQLQQLTTVNRDSAANDGEVYRYDSSGARVRKISTAQAKTVAHQREVRYLPGLEIRTLDASEELQVISVALGRGSVRCLHWVAGKPAGIEADQLRYSVDDHLGSSSLELDKSAAVISHEGYYPYGGTAWWAARSQVEADYKTIRYSGKEQDASGLVYYGLRYLAPWLGRWVNPDPLGIVDGLNVYRMVGNNPVNFVDDLGGVRSRSNSLPGRSMVSLEMQVRPPRNTSPVGMQTIPANVRYEVSYEYEGNTLPALHRFWRPVPPPMPVTPGGWLKRAALWALESQVGQALFPPGTTSVASSIIAGGIAGNIAQAGFAVLHPNPNWSPPATWPGLATPGQPTFEETQKRNLAHNTITTLATSAGTLIGAVTGAVFGGFADWVRGTAEKKDKKEAVARRIFEADNKLNNIENAIFELRNPESTTYPDWGWLISEVLRVEEQIGYTWRTMQMLEDLREAAPANNVLSTSTSNGTSPLLSRQSSDSGLPRSRIPVRTPSSRNTSSSSLNEVLVSHA
jgi:insecticidal toxin complex protein TccC